MKFKCRMTLGAENNQVLSRYRCLVIFKCQVTNDAEKYKNAYRLRGAFILEKAVCDFVPEGTSDLAKQVLPAVIDAGKNFYGYECADYSKGIDTLEKRDEVQAYLASQNGAPWW